ncbi:hypothetical protein JCM10207_000396 [Rhodosporidiobolus poonsookiae]
MSWFSGSSNRQDPPPPTQQPPPRAPPGQYSHLPTSQQPAPTRHHLPSSYAHQQPQHPQYDTYEKQRPAYPQGQSPAPSYSSAPRQPPPSRSAAGGGGAGRGGRFAVVEAPSASHALSNRIVLNQQDWGDTPYVRIKGHFVYATMFDPKISPGTIGAARLVRQFAQLSQSGDVVDVEAFDPASALGGDAYLASVDLEIGYWFEKNATPEAYSADELQSVFVRAYDGLVLTVGQPLVFDFHGQNLRATVRGMHTLALGGAGGGGGGRTAILTGQSEVNFVKDPASAIKIKSSAKKCVSFPSPPSLSPSALANSG